MASKKLAPLLADCGHLVMPGAKCEFCVAAPTRPAVEEVTWRAQSDNRIPDYIDPTHALAGLESVGVTTGATKHLGDTPTPGVYDMLDSEYFKDPLRAYGTESLSGSSARFLLPPSTPAHFRARIDAKAKPTAAMIFGKAVHALVTGSSNLAPFDGASWSSKAADAFLAEHDPDGDDAPILERDVLRAQAMAGAVLSHPIGAKAFSGGKPEQALFAQDPIHGVWLRGKADYLTKGTGGTLVIPDLKTTSGLAHESVFSRQAADLSYHIQDAHYERIANLLGLADEVMLIFVVVESEPPFGVAVHQVSADDLSRARELHSLAVHTFAACLDAGKWPGYPETITKLTLPIYAARREEDVLYDKETA